MATLGINIYVCLGDTIIAGTRSNEIQTSVDTIETSSPTSGIWKQHKNIRKDWSLSTSFLCLANEDVQKLLQIGNTYTIQVVGQEGSSAEELLSGTAILTSCKITASVANLVQGSFIFDGNGELTSDQPVPPTPQNPEIAWSAASASATIGGTNTFPTLSNPHNLAITFASSDTSVATVDSSGVVTLVAPGSANISASFAGSAEYYASTVTYALAVEAALPYDAEVEYLESSGTQYIDTGIKASGNIVIKTKLIDFFKVENKGVWPFGGRDGFQNKMFGTYINSSTGNVDFAYNSAFVNCSTYSTFLATSLVEIGNGVIKIGDSYTKGYTTQTFTSSFNVILFGLQNGASLIRTSVKIGDTYISNGTIIRDFIPVRIGTTGYMYDRVSGELFGNSGTGAFTVGPDKN